MKHLLKSTLGIVILSAMLSTPTPAFAAQPDYQMAQSSHRLLTTSLPETDLTPFTQEVSHPHGTTVFGLPVNEGPIDRTIRGIVAAGLIGTAIYGLTTKQISEPISYTLLGVSAIPTLTAATGFCPIYPLFGIDYTF